MFSTSFAHGAGQEKGPRFVLALISLWSRAPGIPFIALGARNGLLCTRKATFSLWSNY